MIRTSGKRKPKFMVNNMNKTYTANRQITEILRTDQWSGKRCFIIGGGEALESFDFTKLKGEKTIGINKAFLFCNTDILYSMDIRYYFWLMEGRLDEMEKDNVKGKWLASRAVKTWLCPISYHKFHPSVYLIRRMNDKGVYRDLKHGIYGGNNSGFGALMLAIALGANPIYLLGYAMKCNTKTHFHTGYPESKLNRMQKKVISYKKMFEHFAPKIKETGKKVVNLVIKDKDETALSCFDIEMVNNIL